MDYTALDRRIEHMQDEMVEDIRRWISINSVQGEACGENAPFGREVRRALDMALADGKKYGFRVRDLDGYCGELAMGQGDEVMGMLCHLDVVPAGDGWTKDPFGGEIENGRLYGRGTMDDKGPAVAAMYAMRAVLEENIPLKHEVRLILGCDEETGMSDMKHYRAVRGKLPDYGFSPDAEFPVINIEKGGLNILLSKTTGGEEGAELPVYALRAGVRPNVVPGLATAVVGTAAVSLEAQRKMLAAIGEKHGFDLRIDPEGDGRAVITATGVSAHASTPHLGKNAAGMLLIALAEMGAGGGSKGAIAALAEKVGMEYDGNRLGVRQQDEQSGPLTCNLGILRYDGVEITAQLDIRYPLCADETEMCGKIAMAVSDDRLAVTRLGGHTPHHVPKDHRLVKGLLKVYGEVTGLPAYAFAIGGGTYSRCMPNTVAFGINFPGDVDTCHMPDEYMELDKLTMAVKVFAHAIVELAGAQA